MVTTHFLRRIVQCVLVSLTLLVLLGQIACVLSAVFGGRINRIDLMGVVWLSPIAVVLCLLTAATLWQPGTNGRHSSTIVVLIAFVMCAQLAILFLG